jgi:Ca-activated chloride channel homolog
MTLRTLSASALLACGILLAPHTALADPPVTLEARLAQPVMQDGVASKNYLRIGLQGCKPEPSQHRTPVNVSLVIDRSGSMTGPRIAQAKAAAIMAVSRLTKGDIASVVLFDHRIEVLVPAQEVADPAMFAAAIAGVQPMGETAIHAGVLQGAIEVRKFKDPKRLNRVILLSDGQANVGPSRPDDFALLGAALLADGISVSTVGVGLGYNEDLMAKLARAGDGNHAFAKEPDDLVQIFNKEFDDVLGSCAQTVSIDLELRPGVKVVSALSREGTIEGGRASFKMNQVYAATEHYVLVEVEVDKTLAKAGESSLGLVKVAFTVPQSGARQTIDAPISARFSASEQEVQAGRDLKVTEAVVEQVTRERAQRAILLRDQGKYEEARELFIKNAAEIKAATAAMPNASPRLMELGRQYHSFGIQAAPTSAGQKTLERKILRQMDTGVSGAATRY